MDLGINRKSGFSILALGFWILSILIFCNINGITFLLFDKLGMMSEVMLITVIVMMFFIRMKKSEFNVPAQMYIVTLLSIFFLSIPPSIYYFGETNFEFRFVIESLREMVTAIMIFIFFYLSFHRLSKEQKLKNLRIVFFLFVFTCLFGVFESSLGIRERFTASVLLSDRTLGLFANPNEMGVQANFLVVMTLGLYYARVNNIFITLGALILGVFGVVISLSKTSMFVCVFLFLIISFYSFFNYVQFDRKQKERIFRLFMTVFLFFILVIPPVFYSFYDGLSTSKKERIDNLSKIAIEREVTSETTSYRSDLFLDGVNLIKAKPIFGYGMLSFTRGGMLPRFPRNGVHNIYVRIWGEAGILALFLFILFILSYFTRSVFINDPGIAIITTLSFFVILMAGLASHQIIYQKLPVAYLGLLCGFLNFNRPLPVKG